MIRRQYTPEERAAGVALAAAIGPLRAAKQLGFHPRTVSWWTHRPAAVPIIAKVETTIAERLAVAHEKALQSVLDGLDDPKARLSDRAAALRVLGEQRLLAEGRATSRSENLSVTASLGLDDLSDVDKANLRRALDDAIAAQTLDAVRADPLADLDRDAILALVALIESKIGEQSS